MAEFLLKERTFQFSANLLKYFRSVSADKEFSILKIQLFRSASSIGANISEGVSGSSEKEFSRYLKIALRSCNESNYWLRLILEVYSKEIDKVALAEFISETEQIARILNKSIQTLSAKFAANGSFSRKMMGNAEKSSSN
jgi:four helix bundle protein